MLKLFVKLMVVILVLALAGPFFIRGQDGQPLIGFDDIAHRWNRLVTRFRPDAEPLPVYRWQDADGNWHFSDTANPDGASELIYVDPDKNVVPIDDPAAVLSMPDAIRPPGSIQKVLDEAREATKSMEERNEDIEQRTEEER